MPRYRQLLAAPVIFFLGVCSTLVAQSLGDSPQRQETHRTDLSGAPGMEVILSTGEYRPGDHMALHSHHGVEALYVIEGATIQWPGEEPRDMPSGATALNPRDVAHAGFTVVGDKPLKILTVHVVDKGKPLYVYGQEE